MESFYGFGAFCLGYGAVYLNVSDPSVVEEFTGKVEGFSPAGENDALEMGLVTRLMR